MIWPLLKTRRWLGFTAVVVGAIVAFGLLSHWQWTRADDKREQRTELEAALASAPVPLSQILAAPDGGIAAADQWRAVSLTGRYLSESQVLARKRPLDARNGFWVLTAMQGTDGTVAWINRGWLPAGPDALSTPDSPAPPAGDVTVTGYLRSFERADDRGNEGLPPGQIAAVAPSTLPSPSSGFPGYVQLSRSDPEQTGLEVLPLPTVDEGRNISYAIQWLIFALVAISGWYFFLRREAREDAERAASEHDASEPIVNGG